MIAAFWADLMGLMRAFVVVFSLALLAAVPVRAADPTSQQDENAPPAAAPAQAPAARPAEAPFGLKWGMHLNDLEGLGVQINSTSKNGDLTIVNAKTMAQAFPDTATVNMLFDSHAGLVKVRWIGKPITDDLVGTKGRAKYGEMKKMVLQNLGNPTDETMVVGARLFDQEDEFYQCLSYDGCGVWSTLWEQKPSGGVLLSIEGEGPGRGFVQIDYESANWQKVVAVAK